MIRRKVGYSRVRKDAKLATRGLGGCRPLGRRLRMRHTPEVSFHYDEGLDATDRVARLLDRVRSEERGGGDDGD